jgi:hypothetical protein
MSQYWDCSMDQVYDIPDLDDEEASSSPTSASDLDIQMSYADYPDLPSAKLPPTKKTKQVYKGRRIGTGSAMPLTYRDETVVGLIETVVWAYNCQLWAPNLPPRLAVRNLLFPVRQSFIVGRLPKERDMARKGVLEGPVMGVCCRGETDFGKNPSDVDVEGGMTAGKEGAWRGALDLTREAAVLLLLAQERAREGKSEVKHGEGKWWTSVPRWGGGPSGAMKNDFVVNTVVVGEEKPTTPPPSNAARDNGTEMGNFNRRPGPSTKRKASTPDDALPASSHSNTPAADGSGSHHKKPSSSKPTQAEKWKTLTPGPGTWDKKMRYMRIGAPSPPPSRQSTGGEAHDPAMATANATAKEDRVFMITSLNHHVALLSLDVSDRYLEWLAGREEQQQPQQQQQQPEKEDEVEVEGQQEGLQIRLKRTRWFDLFNEADRVEFVVGLWVVMAWLMKDSVEGAGLGREREKERGG